MTHHTARPRAPFAAIEARRREPGRLRVVLGATDARDELLVTVDPVTGWARAELHTTFEAVGEGTAELVRHDDHVAVAVVRVHLRGIDTRSELCELVELHAAITWSTTPIDGGCLQDVAGTALVFRERTGVTTELRALPDHVFNSFAALAAGTGSDSHGSVARNGGYDTNLTKAA